MKIRKFGAIFLNVITLPACIFILVEIWFLRNMQGDESFLINLIVVLIPLGMVCFYFHTVFSYLQKVNWHLTDTIIIDERGIRQESRKGENKLVAWDEIDNIRRLTCHRSPPIISVTATDGGRLWWYAYGRRALKYIQSQHPEIPITEPKTSEDWGEGGQQTKAD